MGIDEYLRDRLMPVEGAIPHLPGIEMYGNSIPAETVGGDLFEYINFQQRYDIDARIMNALKSAAEFLKPNPPAPSGCNSSDDYLDWLRSRPEYRTELEAAYQQVRSLEKVRIAENLTGLHETAGVLLVDAQGHGAVAKQTWSTTRPSSLSSDSQRRSIRSLDSTCPPHDAEVCQETTRTTALSFPHGCEGIAACFSPVPKPCPRSSHSN